MRQLLRGVWSNAPNPALLDLLAAYSRQSRETHWFSHVTAAGAHGIWLPPRYQEPALIDVSVPFPARSPRASGIRGRQRSTDPSRLTLVNGVRVSDPAQTFVDLVDVLSFEDLVAAGDSIVAADTPLTSVDHLDATIRLHRGKRGYRHLVEARNALHSGSRSRPETLFRLALLDQGLPMPRLNTPIKTSQAAPIRVPDAAYWEARALVEYEGDQHRTDRGRWQSDLDRFNEFQRDGWSPFRFSVRTRAKLLEDAAAFADHVRARWDVGLKPPVQPLLEGFAPGAPLPPFEGPSARFLTPRGTERPVFRR